MRILPNRYRSPLSTDERTAELYADQPWRLLELAKETGNRGLYGVAIHMIRQRKERKPRQP